MIKFSSRKWILSLLSIFLLTILVCFAKIPTNIFENLFGLVVSAYILGNVSSRYIDVKGSSNSMSTTKES